MFVNSYIIIRIYIYVFDLLYWELDRCPDDERLVKKKRQSAHATRPRDSGQSCPYLNILISKPIYICFVCMYVCGDTFEFWRHKRKTCRLWLLTTQMDDLPSRGKLDNDLGSAERSKSWTIFSLAVTRRDISRERERERAGIDVRHISAGLPSLEGIWSREACFHCKEESRRCGPSPQVWSGHEQILSSVPDG